MNQSMPVFKLIIEYAMLGLLLVLSMLALAVALERWRYYRALDVSQFQSRAKLQKELTQRLTVISTIASNAPYIGLLGTVLGIMLTFQTLGQSGNIDVKSMNCRVNKQGKATISMGFDIHSKEELQRISDKLRNIEGMLDIVRTTG